MDTWEVESPMSNALSCRSCSDSVKARTVAKSSAVVLLTHAMVWVW